MDISNADKRRLLRDGGLHSIQMMGGSYVVTLPKKKASEAGVSKQSTVPVVPSDKDDVLFEIGYPDDSDTGSKV